MRNVLIHCNEMVVNNRRNIADLFERLSYVPQGVQMLIDIAIIDDNIAKYSHILGELRRVGLWPQRYKDVKVEFRGKNDRSIFASRIWVADNDRAKAEEKVSRYNDWSEQYFQKSAKLRSEYPPNACLKNKKSASISVTGNV